MADIRKIIRDALDGIGIPCDKTVLDACVLYAAELKKWNKVYNLTSITDDRDIALKHIVDSALYLPAIPESAQSLADVGSGGGFPGLVIKIFRPNLRLYLIEPVKKKCAFLRNMTRKLSTGGVTVIEGRAEQVLDVTVDVVVTRALFRADEFMERAGHLLNAGGVLVISKGPGARDELDAITHPHELRQYEMEFGTRFIVAIRRAEDDSENQNEAHDAPRNLSGRAGGGPNICANAECKLRKAGCRGFEGCPGFMAKTL